MEKEDLKKLDFKGVRVGARSMIEKINTYIYHSGVN